MIPSIDMMQQYAPNVAPQTIAAIIQVESSGNQYAIGINGPVKRRIRPRSAQEAATEARYWISKGYSVDLGLMQINSRNLPGLGITIEQAFDPAINIQACAKILIRNYFGRRPGCFQCLLFRMVRTGHLSQRIGGLGLPD